MTGAGIFGGAPVGFRVGPLSPGDSATFSIRITGRTKGVTGVIQVDDYTYTPTPDCTDPSCFVKAQATLKIVAAAAPGSGSTGVGSQTGTTPPLADTGAPTSQLLILSLALLVAGAGVLRAGQRRPCARQSPPRSVT